MLASNGESGPPCGSAYLFTPPFGIGVPH